MGEALVSRRGGDGAEGFAVYYTSNSNYRFDTGSNPGLNGDWTTVGSMAANGMKKAAAMLILGYISARPVGLVIPNVGKEVTVPLADTAKGTMYARIILSGDQYLLQAKQTGATSTLYIMYYMVTGM